MLRRTLAIAIKELLQLRRDLRTALTLLAMPVLLLFIYGYALSFDVQHIRLAVVDEDGGRAARDVKDAFLESGYFDLVAYGGDIRTLDHMFDAGSAQAALIVPPRYGDDLAAHRRTTLQFVLDGSDSQTATTILGYARQIVASVSPVVPGGARDGPVAGVPLVWYNPDMASARFLVPGLLAFLSVQEWPAREACPNCKRLRLVDRQHCERCGADWAPPEKTGTEVFAPLQAS